MPSLRVFLRCNYLLLITHILLYHIKADCELGVPCAECTCDPTGSDAGTICPFFAVTATSGCAPFMTDISCTSPMWHEPCTVDGIHGGCQCNGFDADAPDGPDCFVNGGNSLWCSSTVGPNGNCGVCVPCYDLEYKSGSNRHPDSDTWCTGVTASPTSPIIPPSLNPIPPTTPSPVPPTQSPVQPIPPPTKSPTKSPIPTPEPTPNPVPAPTPCTLGEPCAECTCDPSGNDAGTFCPSYELSATSGCAPFVTDISCTTPMWHEPCTVDGIAGGCECNGFDADGNDGPSCFTSVGNSLWCSDTVGPNGFCGVCVPCDDLNDYAGGSNHHAGIDAWCGVSTTTEHPNNGYCGDGICDTGENCDDCTDCGVQTGRKKWRWCCDPDTQTCTGRGCSSNTCVF